MIVSREARKTMHAWCIANGQATMAFIIDDLERAERLLRDVRARIAHVDSEACIAACVVIDAEVSTPCSTCCGTGHTSGVYAGASLSESKCRDCGGTGRVTS